MYTRYIFFVSCYFSLHFGMYVLQYVFIVVRVLSLSRLMFFSSWLLVSFFFFFQSTLFLPGLPSLVSCFGGRLGQGAPVALRAGSVRH